jgi:hypothetical protein
LGASLRGPSPTVTFLAQFSRASVGLIGPARGFLRSPVRFGHERLEPFECHFQFADFGLQYRGGLSLSRDIGRDAARVMSRALPRVLSRGMSRIVPRQDLTRNADPYLAVVPLTLGPALSEHESASALASDPQSSRKFVV